MPITAELHDGRRLEFPDGTDPAVVQATVKRMLQPEQQASVGVGDTLRQIPRQVGLGARHLLEGVASIPEIVTEPLRQNVVNPALRAAGMPEANSLSGAAAALGDTMGLPKPETADERVIGDASRMVASSMGMSGAAGKAANLLEGAGRQTAAKVAGLFAANPGTQAVGAAAAGGAGGSVREAGGGPLEQFVAALGAGIAAPLSMMGAKKVVDAAGNVIKTAYNPQRVDVVLEAALREQGIDWTALPNAARRQLREDARAAVYSGQPMNAQALANLADYRRIGATPLTGDLTQNPVTLTQQRNLAKQLANSAAGNEPGSLPNLQNENARRVLETLDRMSNSPMNEFAAGEGIIGSVRRSDAARQGVVDTLYQGARDTAGRSLPLEGGTFTRRANELLQQNLSPKLGAEVDQALNDIASGKTPLTVEYAEQLKTMLARKQRAAQGTQGDLAHAYGLVRQALDEAPLQGSGGATLPGTAGQESVDAFNAARAAARERFQWQGSARFIEDALDGAQPDRFVQKHVIGSSVDELQRIRDQIGQDPAMLNAIRRQLIDNLLQRGSANVATTQFSGAALERGLRAIGDRKLAIFFDPSEIAEIRSAVNVARLSQSQPIGSAVNNSNTAAMALGRVGDLIGKAVDLPVVGPMVAGPVRNLTMRAQTIPLRNLSSALATPAPTQGTVLPIAALLAAPGAQARQDDNRR